MVALDSLQVGGMEGTVQLPTVIAWGTLRLEL